MTDSKPEQIEYLIKLVITEQQMELLELVAHDKGLFVSELARELLLDALPKHAALQEEGRG